VAGRSTESLDCMNILQWCAIACLSFVVSTASGEPEVFPPDIKFPQEIEGGLDGLKSWIDSRGYFWGGLADTVALKGKGTLALVLHNPFSGRNAVHPYIYGCTATKCTLILSSRIAIDNEPSKIPLKLRVSQGVTILQVRGADGTIYLQARLPRY